MQTTNDDFASKAIEQKVLSYLLEYPKEQVEYFPRLDESDFYHFTDTYRLYEKLHDSNNEELDSPTIFSKGDEIQVNDIMRTSVSPGEIDSLIRNLKELTIRRRLLRITKDIQATINNEDSIRESIVDLEDKFLEISEGFYSDDSLKPVSALVDSVQEHLKQLRETDNLSGVAQGLTDLEGLTQGYQDGEYILIAARTSVGKTDFMLNNALEAARNGEETAIFSLEMNSTELIKRLSAQISGVNRQAIRRGNYNDHKADKIKNALKELSTLPLYIDDESNQVDELSYKIQRGVKQGNMDIAFIDYFGLLNMPKVQRGTVQNDKEKASNKLKFLAKDVEIPVVVLAQLNRGAEKTDKPKLAHLRGTGALEQDSDVALLLSRPGMWKDDTPQTETEIYIKKQRNGPTGKVKAHYGLDTGVFSDAEYE